MDKTADTALRAWSDKVAALGVEMLVERGFVQPSTFDEARNLVAGKIRIRVLMGDRPPDLVANPIFFDLYRIHVDFRCGSIAEVRPSLIDSDQHVAARSRIIL